MSGSVEYSFKRCIGTPVWCNMNVYSEFPEVMQEHSGIYMTLFVLMVAQRIVSRPERLKMHFAFPSYR